MLLLNASAQRPHSSPASSAVSDPMPTHDPLVLGLPYYIWCIVLDDFGYDSLKVVTRTCKALNSMHRQTELEIHPELLLRPRCACWNLAHIKPASGDAKPSGACPAALKTEFVTAPASSYVEVYLGGCWTEAMPLTHSCEMGVTAEQVLLAVKQHINWLSPNPIHVPACTNVPGIGHRFYGKWYSAAATRGNGIRM
ncbi:hypothetical protein JCM1840_004959 [Sporobolomyces johnsonii]